MSNQQIPDKQQTALGTSPSSPAPAGMTLNTTIERGQSYFTPKLYNVKITLTESIRGKAALEYIQTQGLSVEPLQTGYEYILARIDFGYFRKARGGQGELYVLTEGQFAAFSSDGITEYEGLDVSKQPDPGIVGHTFQPDELYEGYVLLQVPENEEKPLLVFKRQHVEGAYGIWGFLWFQL